MKALIAMNQQGRLTVPAAARQALRIHGSAQFEVEVEENRLILRPVLVIPSDDAWAYTPNHLAQVERAKADARDGRVFTLTEQDIKRLTGRQ